MCPNGREAPAIFRQSLPTPFLQDGSAPVHLAAIHGCPSVMGLLLADPRADPAARDWVRLRGREEAASRPPARQPFLALTRRPSALQLGRTPLHWAAFGGFSPVVSLLLADTRVDPNAIDSVRRWVGQEG